MSFGPIPRRFRTVGLAFVLVATSLVAVGAAGESRSFAVEDLRAHEGAGGKAILRLGIRFDDKGRKGQVQAWGKTPTNGRSGGWMVHCHNQEHSDSGMMTFLELRKPRFRHRNR